MMKIYKIIILVVIGVLAISCNEDFFEKPIDLDINDHESKMAATAFLGIDDDSNRVLVSYSVGPFDEDNGNQIIENATITLSSDLGEEVFTKDLETDFYSPNNPYTITFTPNKTYTLKIESLDYPTISATQIYPEPVTILEASINENTFKIKFNDNPNKDNYYVLKLQEVNGSNNYSTWLEPFGSITKFSGVCDDCVIFSDETFNGEQNFEIVVTNYGFNVNATYKAILYNVTKDFYQYDQSLLNSDEAEDNPFVEPVILHRNFENGYGIFTLANKTELVFNL